jgi:PrtD family type I secretion system ABC transporter
MNSLLALLKRPLLHVAGLSFFVNLLLLGPALFMLQVFDRVLASRSAETLLMLLIGMGVALAMMWALDHLRGRLQGVSGALLGQALSPTVVRTLLARGARRHEALPMEGLRDVATLRNLFSAQGLLAMFDAPWVLVYVAVIWLAHPLLGVAAALAAVLMLGLAIANDRLTKRDIEVLQREASVATRELEDSLANAEVAQTMGMADALLGRWQKRSDKVAELQRNAARKSVAMASFTRMTRQAVQVAMQATGAWLVITQQGTPGVLVATTILLGRALSPVEQVVGSWRVLAEARLAWGRLEELLGKRARLADKMPLPAPVGALTAQGVVWRAPGNERVILGGVSLALEAGESLAIVGASGAGKSTLVRLLTGVWAPNAGSVRLDGVDVAQWPRGELGPHIGYVPQDVELFAGTVGDNIARLGQSDPALVIAAARQAQVHEMILALPQGYDTPIDPRGALLSPGQRQRIALARALYGNPKFVVLDEPNSNLDGAGELALAETLRALSGHATVVVVTHRATLVQHVDKMLVLEAGRVQHFGTVAAVTQAMQGNGLRNGPGQVVAMPRPALAGGAHP